MVPQRRIEVAVLSAIVGVSCSEPSDTPPVESGEVAEAQQPVIPEPSGFERYCSVVNGDQFEFAYGAGDPTPCITALTALPGGTVVRAGLWSNQSLAYNRVVAECTTLWGGKVRKGFYGIYDTPMDDAVAWATNAGYEACEFTVAPRNLSIFQRPMSQASMEDVHATMNGFDFAYNVAFPYDGNCLTGIGEDPVTGGNLMVDWRGHGDERFPEYDSVYGGYGPSNSNHSGYDWTDQDEVADRTGNEALWSVFSVADGTVVQVRTRYIGNSPGACAGPGPSCQLEVYIKHVVGTGNYREEFISYYAHLDSTGVSVGDVVSKGSYVGIVGATGCGACHEHLHFAVFRLTNTASEWRVSWSDLFGGLNHIERTQIDPFGYMPSCVDPWGLKFSTKGAMSIRLWQDSYAWLDWKHH